MVIMAASGIRKLTFLDILAWRNKWGEVSSRILVNGQEVKDEEFQKVTGFVDQDAHFDYLWNSLVQYTFEIAQEHEFWGKKV